MILYHVDAKIISCGHTSLYTRHVQIAFCSTNTSDLVAVLILFVADFGHQWIRKCKSQNISANREKLYTRHPSSVSGTGRH